MGEFSDYDDDDDGDFANFDMDAAIASGRRIDSIAPEAVTALATLTTTATSVSLSKENGTNRNDPPSPPAKKMRSTPATPKQTPSTHDSFNVGVASNQDANYANIDVNNDATTSTDNNNYDDDNDDDNVPTQFTSQLTHALVTHFGHSTFRTGQLSVLHSIMIKRRDTCVFWATGAGKSLCYQLPPMQTNTVCIVVSPLLSLMEDQVAKLNGRGLHDIAAFLGSSQMDTTVEERALRGEYRLVYVTPEKLISDNGSYLNKLATMHGKGGHRTICLFAIDESHCVSQWGHDFRPCFLHVGPSLRDHPVLRGIPILALTATAVPRVQEDIICNLRMNRNDGGEESGGVTIVKQTFDRPNLKISICRRPMNGITGAFENILIDLAKTIAGVGSSSSSSSSSSSGKTTTTSGGGGVVGGGRKSSTIVYCSTRKEVDDITMKITQCLAHQIIRLEQQKMKQQQQHLPTDTTTTNTTMSLEHAFEIASTLVQPYHAGLAHTHRSNSHTNFLIGRVAIIVATVAFGMGIDKPDIRRVVHWGPCKNVEEYYQQIGRAGRDGLPAECIMYVESNDFVKYKDDFYLGGLSGSAKVAAVCSMDALRDFCMSTNGCRRAALLTFFEEMPSFGKYCGSCDLCLSRKDHGDDYERDFQWEGARVVLAAVMACPNQPMSMIETIIKGGSVDSYRYHNDFKSDPSKVSRKIVMIKEKMKKKKPIEYFKGLFPSLVDRGYLTQRTMKSSHASGRNYLVYNLTAQGIQVVLDGPIVLPVPSSIREQEKLEEAKKQRTLAELKDKGVDIENIPQSELESGDGEAISAYKRWYSYVDSWLSKGRSDMVDQLDDMKSRIEGWRMDMAERYRMAPSSVMEEHLLVRVCYATASLGAGGHMNKDALIAAGVRSNGINELTFVLNEWVDKVHKHSQSGENENEAACVMTFVPGEPFRPANSWRFAVYKPNKKSGKAAWELSYDRFAAGEHPQTIAMTQASGKPIQVATVVGHILEALTMGRAVDLHRLSSSETPPPTKSEWEDLARCSIETGIDVTGDPTSSGRNSEQFSMKDFLIPVMGDAFALTDYKERSSEESDKWNKWCGCLKWYLAMLRVGYEPSFSCSRKHD